MLISFARSCSTRLLLCAMLSGLCPLLLSQPASAQKTKHRIMVVQDSDSKTMNNLRELLIKEIKALYSSDEEIRFELPRVKGGSPSRRVRAALDEAFRRKDIDLVIGIGPSLGVELGKRKAFNKPVILPYAEPSLQGLPRTGSTSGKKNLAYITGLLNMERDLRQLLDIVRFERVAFIAAYEVASVIPRFGDALLTAAKELDIQATLVVAKGQNVSATLAAIPKDAQAVYLGASPSWSRAQIQALIDGINQRRLPSYAVAGVSWVKLGALATMTRNEDEVRRMRRAALYTQRALEGDDPASFNVAFIPRPQLVINMATASQIGVWPRFELMAEARLLGQDSTRQGPTMTLEEAITRALQTNYDLMAQHQALKSSREDLREARGALLPRMDSSGSYTWNDPDTASSFANAERTLAWGMEGSQLLYAAKAQSGLRASKRQYKASQHALRTTELDIMQATGEAYLDVLRAKTAVRVNRENLHRARKNLTLAETRNQIGVAGREEVYRWQIEIADSRSQVIAAEAQWRQAEIELNRSMNRPLDSAIETPEIELPYESLMDQRIAPFVDNPWSFKIFRDFAAQEALKISPEIKELDQAIAAQKSLLGGERRALFIPDSQLNAGFTHIPHTAGKGSGAAPAGGGLPGRDDFGWQAGIGLSFNVLDGGQRYARIRRLQAQIEQLEAQRASVAQRVEQSVRSSFHQVASSSADIGLARDASEAATKNLELVTDAYQRGAVDVITLIDAQNQALLNELNASNAVYDFLIDIIRVQRAGGRLWFELSQAEQDAYVQRLGKFSEHYQDQTQTAHP